MRTKRGLTLVEVVVVLIVMGVALAVVGVALSPRRAAPGDELTAVLTGARATAVRRAETLRLEIDRSGAWSLVDIDGIDSTPASSGRFSQRLAQPVSIVFSPFGTCGPDVRSAAALHNISIDPVTCAVRIDR